MIIQSKITSKRQITIPIRIMRKLGLNPGDSIAFEEKDDHIEIASTTKKFSALEISQKFAHLKKKKASQKEIDQARVLAWTQRNSR